MSPSPIELATVVASLGRPRTVPVPDGQPVQAVAPEHRPRLTQPVRQMIGAWLIAVGGAIAGQRQTSNPIA